MSFAVWEMRTSHYQAKYLAGYARGLSYDVASGASPAAWYPTAGPYDWRLGYTRLPHIIERLEAAGFQIQAQARLSPAMLDLTGRNLTLPYREKTQAGLRVVDRDGATVFQFQYPERIYESFEAVPPIVVRSLLFIEDRNLLDDKNPQRNPAVDWLRLARAAFERGLERAGIRSNSPGGSTLATQLEKSRHSAGGITRTVDDKLRQMASASLRAYLGGANTRAYRRQVVIDYLNTLPLGARAGYGEIIGLATGLEQWYGADFEAANTLLRTSSESVRLDARARAYKQVLSLLLAQRRPSRYLTEDREALHSLTDSHLRALAEAGVIARDLAEAALPIKLEIGTNPLPDFERDVWDMKAANAVRPQMLSLFALPDYYELDRLDLTAQVSLDRPVQEAVTRELRALANPERLHQLGLDAPRMLDRGDPTQVRYSVSLYERGEGANWLRLQADNMPTPFNMSAGAKLDLGSTAKLRTLISYLNIVASLYQQYAALGPEELRKIPVHRTDALSAWVIRRLADEDGTGLRALLEEALDRRYSASPSEAFFTGGGSHRFANFDPADDRRVLTVRQAFRNSVNLVFVRMMRDIVRFHQYHLPGSPSAVLENPDDPRRVLYLERFADREGRTFLRRFYEKYRGKTASEAREEVLDAAKSKASALAAVFRYVEPSASVEAVGAAIRARLPKQDLDDRAIRAFYDKHGPDRYDLQDRAYISGVHPLELWFVAHLQREPQASLSQVLEQSAEARLDVYRWLFATKRRHKQDVRIRTLLEIEAFVELHREWQRLGYPFDHLVPSYATAIGSSADRPSALAELMGILLNDGVRLPTRSIERLHFGEGTPYEAVLAPAPSPGERVMPAEVAGAVREALVDVVENGTAKRARGAVVDAQGLPVRLGGKTGTGDHREKRFGAGGRLLGEHAVNRTATFVFFIDDRFYGVLTAHVAGEQAAHYRFTSALAVQLFKALLPKVLPAHQDKPGINVEVALPPLIDLPAS